jgi:hypothetical protein
MRCFSAVIIAVSLMVSPAPAQESGRTEAEHRRARLDAHKGDFDYLLGEWRFTTRHAEFGEGAGYWTAVRLATGDGSHILDEYRVVGDSGETYYASTTLRVFNAARGTWELVSAETGSGLVNVGTARRVGDEMHIEQRFGGASGNPDVWRIRYYDIRPDAFSWIADRSVDGGTTWQRSYMTIEARRLGPARSLEPLTRVNRRRTP